MLDNYVEQTKPLFKLLRTEAFRFVIVRYNHFSFVQELEKDVKRLFPNRPFQKVDVRKLDYQDIVRAYYALESGFFFIENFDDILKEQQDIFNKETPQYEKANLRRRHITAGLNLRRDKLAQYPIALFVFVPATTGELYAKTIMEKMPDLWSFRSIILDLEKDLSEEQNTILRQMAELQSDVITQGDTIKKVPDVMVDAIEQTELNRLITLLNKTPKTEITYRLTLYPQIVDNAIEIGQSETALSYLDEWQANSPDSDKGLILLKKGDVIKTLGQLKEAHVLFEKAKLSFEKNDDKINVGTSLERLGDIYSDLGDLTKALQCHEQGNVLFKELFEVSPSNSDYKKGLAISYAKLGETNADLGNLDKALQYYEDYFKLEKQLYDSYPNNVEFKNGLAITYEKLGKTHADLGNLDKALFFYEQRSELGKELHQSYPNNVEFKNGLAISYSKLGETHAALGNLDKALFFYEIYARLVKELYNSYSNNVAFKNGLAIAYEKLGQTHVDMGNLDKVLYFYEASSALSKQLYESYPTIIEFKNGLAVSYAQIGVLHKDIIKDKAKARLYFKQAETLWLELVHNAPQYVVFQKALVSVQGILKDL